ncbi:MAG TPA: PP2C family protein-serine/threonine phosphatase, partial [Thermoanaerobaculia bacterium]|nr:PP2C family protein-serine/threonine phosphatase [Thermoanaerobaculia bacterium]
SSDGNARFLGATGVPLGLIPRATYRLETVELAPGDLLCLYSDGITECSGTSDEEYGLARLVETLSAHRHLPLAELMAKIDQEVTDFAEGEPQGDDQTVVLVRRVELD